MAPDARATHPVPEAGCPVSGAHPLSGRVPPAARGLLLSCVDAGWDTIIRHGVDTGGSPFVTITAQRSNPHGDPDGYLNVTWHTRATGNYRLFHCLIGRSRGSVRDESLKAAKALIDGGVS